MQPIYRQKFQINDMAVDRFGRLKLSTLLFYAQEIAGQHSALLGADYQSLSAKNLFWAVTRHRVQITRLPMTGETITVETWPMPTTKVAYPRSFIAFDADGKELFRAISLWVLMDQDNRNMVLPGKSGVLVEGTLTGSELTVPHSLAAKSLCNETSRTVTFSCLDRNGHMNNTRYLDWVEDLQQSNFHQGHIPSEFVICYLNEAKEDQEILMNWEMNETGCLQVDARRQRTGVSDRQDRVFSAQVQYI